MLPPRDMRASGVLGAAIVTVTSACGSSGSGGGQPPPINATSYDQSCQSATDCILVSDGNVCQPCISGPFDSCAASAGINVKDRMRFQTDYDALKAQCPSHAPQSCPNICAIAFATCVAGTCAVCNTPGCADGGSPDAGGRDASGDAAHD